jgi:hypothetical protein
LEVAARRPERLTRLTCGNGGGLMSAKQIQQCPACVELGRDKDGKHLVVFPDGKFGCVAFPGVEGRQHRQRVFELMGGKKQRNNNLPTTPLDMTLL